jgi:hypothetical protein
VDCLAWEAGDGSEGSPFNSLTQANSIILEPGESLLFKRGATCLGALAPQGQGDSGALIMVGAYGDGDLHIRDDGGTLSTKANGLLVVQAWGQARTQPPGG